MKLHKLMVKINKAVRKAPSNKVRTYIPVTVAVNGIGYLHIVDVEYCAECKEYHIELGEKSVTNETTESEVVGTVSSTEFSKIEILKAKVVLELVTTHDFPMEAAAEAVEESSKTDPDQWNVNSDSEELANDLASSDDDA